MPYSMIPSISSSRWASGSVVELTLRARVSRRREATSPLVRAVAPAWSRPAGRAPIPILRPVKAYVSTVVVYSFNVLAPDVSCSTLSSDKNGRLIAMHADDDDDEKENVSFFPLQLIREPALVDHQVEKSAGRECAKSACKLL